MSHTRSAKHKVTGKFTVQVWDWNNQKCFEAEFDTMQEADETAAREERAMMLRMISKDEPQVPLADILADPLISGMTDDELLRELEK